MTMSTLATTTAILPVLREVGPPRAATHTVRIEHQDSYRGERWLLGVLTVVMEDAESELRVKRITKLVEHRLYRVRVLATTAPTTWAVERRTLSNVERFRRKMLKVMRAYDEDRAAIMNGEAGLFQDDRLRELDALLEQAWAKMEQRYGVRREQLEDAALMARVEALAQRGELDTREYGTA